MPSVLGLDIGGANLKAAHTSGIARTIAFPLWKHPDRLTDELRKLCAAMPGHELLAITMTGELCDCYPTKREGVLAILRSVCALATPTRVWSIEHRFLAVEEALANPLAVAAVNWLALAHLVAARFPRERVLLIDVGSTTTDIVYLNQGVPKPRAYTDRDRLATGELVYTGLRRTPVCAVLGMEVAAEFFATMFDVYLFLKLLPEDSQDRDTADGRPATRTDAHARLARMCCADVETFSADDAYQLAVRAMRTQWDAIDRAIDKVLAEREPVERCVHSGSGDVVGRSAWARSKFAALPATSLSELLGPALSEAGCAYAVAMLAAEDTQR